MNIKLKPISAQAVVIFGASSGIGRLAALEFAKRGAKVCVAARGEEGLKTLVKEIEAKGGEAFYIVADATDFKQVKTVADKTVERFGRLDTWIHAAGVFLFATVEKTTPEDFAQVIKTNLIGQFHGAKAALPHLKEKGGALIHISSVEAWRSVPYQAAYGASKHGVSGFIQSLRSEIEHDKIPVSLTQILPGAINTPIYDKGKNEMPFEPRPVPPIYHPQIVVDALLYAAENPTWDIATDSAAAAIITAERFSPKMSDWFSAKIGFAWQKSDQERIGEHPGSLYEAVEGHDTVEGKFSDEQVKIDPYNTLVLRPKLKNTLLAAIGFAGGFIAYRLLRKDEE